MFSLALYLIRSGVMADQNLAYTGLQERIMIEGSKKRHGSILFSMATGPTLKNTVSPASTL